MMWAMILYATICILIASLAFFFIDVRPKILAKRAGVRY